MKLKPPVVGHWFTDSFKTADTFRNETSVLLILEMCTNILLLLLMPHKDVKVTL